MAPVAPDMQLRCRCIEKDAFERVFTVMTGHCSTVKSCTYTRQRWPSIREHRQRRERTYMYFQRLWLQRGRNTSMPPVLGQYKLHAEAGLQAAG